MPSWDRNRRGRSPGSRSKKIAVLAAAIASVAALIGAFGYVAYLQLVFGNLDPKSLCPKTGPVSVLVALIDRTDKLTGVQGEDLERRILAWAADVPKHGQLKIYEISENIGNPDDLHDQTGRVVEVCNPGDGSDESIITSNPERWRKRYEEKFMSPVRNMVAAMQLDKEAAKSPIMEGVQRVAVRDLGVLVQGTKDVILVSDLLQYTDGLNLYKGVPQFDEFWRSGYAASLRANLQGVRVQIFLLNRARVTDKQTDALGAFWVRWLEEQ